MFKALNLFVTSMLYLFWIFSSSLSEFQLCLVSFLLLLIALSLSLISVVTIRWSEPIVQKVL